MVEATTLKDQIAAFTANMAKQAPPEVLASVASEIEKLAISQIATRALAVGAIAPDFTLPDARGGSVSLSRVLAHRNVAVTFYRGGWCPFCDLQLRSYQTVVPEIQARGAELIAISPQTLDYSVSDIDNKHLTFPVLSDVGNRVARSYGLVFKLSDVLQKLQIGFGNPLPKFNGDDSWELPMPGTFVLDKTGRVVLAHVDPSFMVRLEPAAILDSLARLT